MNIVKESWLSKNSNSRLLRKEEKLRISGKRLLEASKTLTGYGIYSKDLCVAIVRTIINQELIRASYVRPDFYLGLYEETANSIIEVYCDNWDYCCGIKVPAMYVDQIKADMKELQENLKEQVKRFKL